MANLIVLNQNKNYKNRKHFCIFFVLLATAEKYVLDVRNLLLVLLFYTKYMIFS
jgi:hypothetical protein